MIDKNEIELKQLFEKWKNSSDSETFELIHNKYNNLVYKIAFTVLKNREDSEDIVQSVFSKIYTLPKDKLPDEHILSWIYSVTKNEAISLFRKNKSTIDIDSIYDIADTDNEMNDIIDKLEFNRIISKLNDKEKEIVSLKLLSDLSFDEIAKLLNKPTGTIKWNYYKSIHTLKLLLSNFGMFIITLAIGLKTMINAKNGEKDNQSNSMENKDNGSSNNQTATESIQQDSSHSVNTSDKREEKNMINNEEQINEEIQIPFNEQANNVNYYGIGILTISGIFLLFTIIFLINFIKKPTKTKRKSV